MNGVKERELINEIRERNIEKSSGLRKNVLMSEFTTFRVGGPARLFFEPEDENILIEVLKLFKEYDVPFQIIGNGSNILVRDEGFDGAILRIGKSPNEVEVSENNLNAPAGVLLSYVSKLALDNGLSGLEFASGIPGSVGGAVFMNAGAYGAEVSDIFKSSKILYLSNFKIEKTDKSKMDFSYRHSILENEDSMPTGIVLSAEFELKFDDKEKISERMKDYNSRRIAKQPLNLPSAGSFFKRPEGNFAAKLIEDSGLKGLCLGNAAVSEKHAGFIVNRGGASASDIIMLMNIVRETVYDRFGVMLEPEVRIIGE